LPTIERFASRAAAAAGKSTNFELVQQQIKLGGNGPILANALATFGARLTYVGALGWPSAHPVFAPFTERAQVHSVADPGLTDALEFEDGKLILSKCDHLRDVNWPNLEARFGRERLAEAFASSELVAFVNWTMLPAMSDIWETLQRELMPQLSGPPRRLFLDLADPEKRRREDIRRALELMVRFRGPFNVTLGLNEKEAGELAKVLELPPRPRTEEDRRGHLGHSSRSLRADGFAERRGGRPGSFRAESQNHHRCRRPFQRGVLPRSNAGVQRRRVIAHGSDDQRPLCANGAKPDPPGPARHVEAMARRRIRCSV